MKKRIIIIVICLVIIILGLIVFLNIKKDIKTVDEKIEAHEINNDYLKDNTGKLVTIKYININCDSLELVLYEDNTYELITGSKNIKGSYDFNVESLFGLVSAQKLDESNNSDWIRYTLTTGKNEIYVTNDNSIPLNNLLKQLNIDLKTCKRYDIKQ